MCYVKHFVRTRVAAAKRSVPPVRQRARAEDTPLHYTPCWLLEIMRPHTCSLCTVGWDENVGSAPVPAPQLALTHDVWHLQEASTVAGQAALVAEQRVDSRVLGLGSARSNKLAWNFFYLFLKRFAPIQVVHLLCRKYARKHIMSKGNERHDQEREEQACDAGPRYAVCRAETQRLHERVEHDRSPANRINKCEHAFPRGAGATSQLRTSPRERSMRVVCQHRKACVIRTLGGMWWWW